MALVDKAGKVIEIGKVDAATAGLLETALEGLEARLSESVAKALGPVAETVKAVTDKITAIEAAAKQPPRDKDGDGKPDPKIDPKGGDLAKQIEALLDAKLAPAIKQVEELKGTLSAKDEQAATAARVDAYIKAKLPNLSGPYAEDMREALLAAKPKDEAAIAAVVTQRRGYYERLGVPKVDVLLGASKTAEGGKGPAGSGSGPASGDVEAEKQRLLTKYPGKPKAETAM